MKNALLSSPIQLGPVTLKNRIVVPPMADFGSTGPDGRISERHLRHYGALARGGAGLLVIEALSVNGLPGRRNTVFVSDDACLPDLKRLAEATAGGAAVLVQLFVPAVPLLPYDSLEAIPASVFHTWTRQFADAAARCRAAGFAGVTLHAAHGLFLNSIVEENARADGYGGSFENRVRLLAETIRAIRAACGRDFIISVRFGHADPAELAAEAAAIERAGGDLLDVSFGCTGAFAKPADFPFGEFVYAASLVKKASSLPVICVGGITDAETAEAILESGYADLTAVGRGHLCDPDWAKKSLAGERPVPCRRCAKCQWFTDGELCPARLAKSS